MLFPHIYRTYKSQHSLKEKTKLDTLKKKYVFLLLFSEINVSGPRRVTLDTSIRWRNVLILASEQLYKLLEKSLF